MAAERLWNSNYCKVMVANFALFFADAFQLGYNVLLPLYLSEHFGATKGDWASSWVASLPSTWAIVLPSGRSPSSMLWVSPSTSWLPSRSSCTAT